MISPVGCNNSLTEFISVKKNIQKKEKKYMTINCRKQCNLEIIVDLLIKSFSMNHNVF